MCASGRARDGGGGAEEAVSVFVYEWAGCREGSDEEAQVVGGVYEDEGEFHPSSMSVAFVVWC